MKINEQAVVTAYNKLNKERKDLIIPGKEEQAKKIVGSLAYLLGQSSNYDLLLELFIAVGIRAIMDFDNERIATTIRTQYANLVPGNKCTAVIECIRRIVKNYAFLSVKKTQENQAYDEFFDAQYEQRFKENEKKAEDALRIPNFGTDPDNPIFAHSAEGSYNYLNLLYTADSIPLTWERKGSMNIRNCEDPLDEYELIIPDGTVFKTVYINMYSRKNSIYSPKGISGKGLKAIPEKKIVQSEIDDEETSEEDEYLAFLHKYDKNSENKKEQTRTEKESEQDDLLDEDDDYYEQPPSDEIIEENDNPVLQGNFPIILEKSTIYKKQSGEVYAVCRFVPITDKSVRAMQIDICCYNVWNEPVSSVKNFQYLDIKTKREEPFGINTIIPLPDPNTRIINPTVRRLVLSDGTQIQRTSENVDIPDLELLASTLGSATLAAEYVLRTYKNARFTPIKLGEYWRCTCGAINSQEERACIKCGDYAEYLFKELDVQSLQASIDKRKRLKKEQEEKERIKREEEEQRAAEERRAREIREAEEEKEKAEKRRKRNKRIAIGSAIAAAIALIIYLVGWQIIPATKYNKADKLLVAGDRDAAYSSFADLGKYKDSQDRAAAIKYEEAQEAFSKGDFDTAIELFSSIPDYSDSSTRVDDSIYQKASLLMKDGSYAQAAELYETIPDYRDSRSKGVECRNEHSYIEASSLFEREEYNAAGELFESIKNYRDSESLMVQSYYLYAKELIENENLHDAYVILSEKINSAGEGYEDSIDLANTSEYQYALDCFSAGKYVDAATSFANLGDYKDSKTRCLESQYQHGLELITDGKYDDAEKLFTDLGSYKDSAKQINESIYQHGLALLEAKKYTEASDVFGELKNYRDSTKQYNEARYQYASQLLSQKKYTEAEKIFEELGHYSDSSTQLKESKYQRAKELVRDKKYKQAVPIFKELGSYSDSADQRKAAMYSYALANNNNNDRTTYEYLAELKKSKYSGSESMYERLYQWKVTLTAVNTDKNDYKTISRSVSKTSPYLHFEFKLEGGPPGEKVTLSHKVYWPDGAAVGGNWYWENKTRGSYLGIEWSEGLYDPRYAKSGDLTLRIYVRSTGELIGQASIYLS